MEMNTETLIVLIGYLLAIFFSMIGLIYGIFLYFMKKEKEFYYEHSRNIIAVAVIFLILRLFASFGSLIF